MGPYAENLAQDCGDFYLRRADGVFAYQLAVVVDDALMGVTQVVRGADLLSSTPRQLWLYRELGLPAPEFYHTPLLLAVDGRRPSWPTASAGSACRKTTLFCRKVCFNGRGVPSGTPAQSPAFFHQHLLTLATLI